MVRWHLARADARASSCEYSHIRLFDTATKEYDARGSSYWARVYELLEAKAGDFAVKVIADSGDGEGLGSVVCSPAYGAWTVRRQPTGRKLPCDGHRRADILF